MDASVPPGDNHHHVPGVHDLKCQYNPLINNHKSKLLRLHRLLTNTYG